MKKVAGIFLARPPIRVMSCSPCIPWITDPAPRKSSALKKAWVIRWKMPATCAAAPTAMNMNPSWEMVENARTRLMSFCARAMVAANSAVAVPTIATTAPATSEAPKIGAVRATR
ncbi:MAG: hypothetical protein A2135_11215 [Actinobacteria bacterium RBG_16_67_15]|nr:MAG: hypothetical protein A2135_11215 [Actinobacteria bacterium RBG_16_67_15]